MTSAVTAIAESIDQEYPIAGIDNNSQGFRDNFTFIKEGLATAGSEITALQNSSARLTQDNNFGGNSITDAVYNRLYGAVFNYGVVDDSIIQVSVANGPLQVITIGNQNTVTLSLRDWPNMNRFGTIRIHIFTNQTSAKTINFGTSNGGVVNKDASFPNPFTIPANSTSRVVELWTYNGGNTVYLKLLGSF
jgi:hypothetical protein